MGHKTDELDIYDRIRHGESLNQQADEQFGVQELPRSLGYAADSGTRFYLGGTHHISTEEFPNLAFDGGRVSSRPLCGRDCDSNSATLS